MSTIEDKMFNAIKSRKNFHRTNTSVENEGTHTNVFLHGNLIAKIDKSGVYVTDCNGWRSNTTKSRLNAILVPLCGVYIYQKNYRWYYGHWHCNDKSDFEPRFFPMK